MDSGLYTSNTPGSMFGITASGIYSPRLAELQSELASGQYTAPDQAAMLGRQIVATYNGTTGDMNAAGSSSMIDQLERDVMKAPSFGASSSGGDTPFMTKLKSDLFKGTGFNPDSPFPTWFSENVMRFVLVLLGVVFLFGAFLTYRK